MAGLSGPALSELPQLYPLADAPSPSGAGDVRAATGGSNDLLPCASVEGLPNDCSNGLGSREKWLGGFVWSVEK